MSPTTQGCGPARTLPRLSRVDVRPPDRDQARQLVLNAVGVLELVDHHMAESLVIIGADFRDLAKELDRLDQQVVEVERVRLLKPLLV